MVNIPIKMYSATQESALDLDMLDKHDNANIRFARINEKTGEEVKYADIVKGYKLDNRYVVLSDEDFEAASPKKSQVVEIEDFVDDSEIDAAYYEAPYFLAPEKGGEKAYVLLRAALEETGKLAIGTYVMRGKQHVCALRPHQNAIMLLRIRFAEELRETTDLALPTTAAIKPAELKIALSLIEQMTPKKFSLAKYKDTYRAELLKVINRKAKGQPPSEAPFKLTMSNTKDLMEMLKRSLEEGSGNEKKAA